MLDADAPLGDTSKKPFRRTRSRPFLWKGGTNMNRTGNVVKDHGADPAGTGSKAAAGHGAIEEGTEIERTNDWKEVP